MFSFFIPANSSVLPPPVLGGTLAQSVSDSYFCGFSFAIPPKSPAAFLRFQVDPLNNGSWVEAASVNLVPIELPPLNGVTLPFGAARINPQSAGYLVGAAVRARLEEFSGAFSAWSNSLVSSVARWDVGTGWTLPQCDVTGVGFNGPTVPYTIQNFQHGVGYNPVTTYSGQITYLRYSILQLPSLALIEDVIEEIPGWLGNGNYTISVGADQAVDSVSIDYGVLASPFGVLL